MLQIFKYLISHVTFSLALLWQNLDRTKVNRFKKNIKSNFVEICFEESVHCSPSTLFRLFWPLLSTEVPSPHSRLNINQVRVVYVAGGGAEMWGNFLTDTCNQNLEPNTKFKPVLSFCLWWKVVIWFCVELPVACWWRRECEIIFWLTDSDELRLSSSHL